jgi:membrane peptidoglycan carboxypeptidase
MALGSGETTPYKLTAAYAAFVNGGRRITPHLMEVVHDRDGKTVFTAEDRNCPRVCDSAWTGEESPRVPTLGERVIDPDTAFQVTSMLEGVVQSGTAVKARVLNRPIAGKTGTTNEYRSAWFVGYTPDLVVGVFVGFDDNRSLGEVKREGSRPCRCSSTSWEPSTRTRRLSPSHRPTWPAGTAWRGRGRELHFRLPSPSRPHRSAPRSRWRALSPSGPVLRQGPELRKARPQAPRGPILPPQLPPLRRRLPHAKRCRRTSKACTSRRRKGGFASRARPAYLRLSP